MARRRRDPKARAMHSPLTTTRTRRPASRRRTRSTGLAADDQGHEVGEQQGRQDRVDGADGGGGVADPPGQRAARTARGAADHTAEGIPAPVNPRPRSVGMWSQDRTASVTVQWSVSARGRSGCSCPRPSSRWCRRWAASALGTCARSRRWRARQAGEVGWLATICSSRGSGDGAGALESPITIPRTVSAPGTSAAMPGRARTSPRRS